MLVAIPSPFAATVNNITKRFSKENIPRTRPGRPRSAEVDEAILQAAFRLLASGGYTRMSVDAVAAEAGVTKPSIYLRFPRGKAELAAAALAHGRDRSRAVGETGDTRSDLVAHLEHFRRGIKRPFGMSMIGTVLAEEQQMPELLQRFREYIVEPRRRRFRAVLDRARERGELRTDTDVDAAIAMLVGAFYAWYLAGSPFPRDWAERVVGTVLDGLRRP